MTGNLVLYTRIGAHCGKVSRTSFLFRFPTWFILEMHSSNTLFSVARFGLSYV